MKKINLLFLAFIVLGIFNVSAQEITVEKSTIYGGTEVGEVTTNINVGTERPTMPLIMPYGTSAPSNVWNWDNGACPVSGIVHNSSLYTNYLFTNVSSLSLGLTESLFPSKFQLYKKNAILWDTKIVDIIVDINFADSGIDVYTISGLSQGEKYYFKILPDAEFTGSISGR